MLRFHPDPKSYFGIFLCLTIFYIFKPFSQFLFEPQSHPPPHLRFTFMFLFMFLFNQVLPKQTTKQASLKCYIDI